MKSIRRRHILLVVLITINIVIGLAACQDYGESWDEPGYYNYAERSLRAYRSLINPSLMPVSLERGDPFFGDHGPAFVMLVTLLRRFATSLGLSFSFVNFNHFVYFIFFQIGLISLYFISLRWMSSIAAFGVTALFSTQPLFWGHAFINPKDAPFMFTLLASVAIGLWMVDRAKEPSNLPAIPDLYKELSLLAQASKLRVLLLALFWLAVLSAIWLWGANIVRAIIFSAYAADSSSLLGWSFHQIATQTDQVSLAQYIQKGLKLLMWFEDLFAIVSMVYVIRACFTVAPGWARASARWLAANFKIGLEALLSPDIWLAALILGFSCAIRIVAPLAGMLVALYALANQKWFVVPRLIIYAILSILVMFALWPHLWPAPLERIAFSISYSSGYPTELQTLFDGRLYSPSQIPRTYLPVLLGLQLTETTFPLVLFGFFVAWKKRIPLGYVVLLLMWFAFPFTWFVVNKISLYDNIRHVMFILPPLFILAGTGLDWLFNKFSTPLYRCLILFVAVLPALIADVNLHPYQYIYYNQFIGGVRGAFRNYQLDYWDTSYRDAALYLNKVAPEGASIVPIGPHEVFEAYARPDLQVIDSYSVTGNWQEYDYIVISTRNNVDLDFKQYETIYTIERAGAVLAVVKRP